MGGGRGATFVLVKGDKVLQLVSMNHDVETAHLRQPELLVLHTSKTYFLPGSSTKYIRYFRKRSTC